MPFKLTAELDTADSKTLWTKSIFALSTISDIVKFTIRQKLDDPKADLENYVTQQQSSNLSYDEILLTAVNHSKTTSVNCSFKARFFASFKIEGELPKGKSSEDNLNYGKSFSFLINSKNLNVLFKDCGDKSDYFKLVIIHGENKQNFAMNRLQRYSNKLHVEFKTKNELTKKYSLDFSIGVDSFDLKISSIYQQLYYNQDLRRDTQQQTQQIQPQEDEEDRINMLVLDTIIFKKLLQLYPSSIEDFKIETNAKTRKLKFYGFNRSDLLSSIPAGSSSRGLSTHQKELASNNLVNLSATLDLNDTIHDNIEPPLGNDDDVSIEKIDQVSFKLKDFKTFVSLISYSNNKTDPLDNDNNWIEIMFSSAGAPIVFERKFTEDSGLKFGNISDNDGKHPASDSFAARLGKTDDDAPEYCTFTLIIITDSEINKVQLQKEKKFKLRNVYNRKRQQKDRVKQEMKGTGISGLTKLSQPTVIPNIAMTNDENNDEEEVLKSEAFKKLEKEIKDVMASDKPDFTDEGYEAAQDYEDNVGGRFDRDDPAPADEPLFVPYDKDEENGLPQPHRGLGGGHSINSTLASSLLGGGGGRGVFSNNLLSNRPDLYPPNDENENDEETKEKENNLEEIFWNNSKYHKTQISQYTTTRGSHNLKRRKLDENTRDLHVEGEEEKQNDTRSAYLGPTQNVPRVKGIFDD